jgi:hypothetical protein
MYIYSRQIRLMVLTAKSNYTQIYTSNINVPIILRNYFETKTILIHRRYRVKLFL